AEEIVQQVLRLPKGTKIQVLAPIVRDKKGEYRKLFSELQAQGFQRVRVNGEWGEVTDKFKLERYEKQNIEAVVDRLTVDPAETGRLTEAIEQGLKLGQKLVILNVVPDKGEPHDLLFSEDFACPTHGATMPELAPRIFSFNSPHGACETCDGLGSKLEIDPDLIIKDPGAPIKGGAFEAEIAQINMWILGDLRSVGRNYGFSVDTPWNKLTKVQKDIVLYGTHGRKVKMEYEGSTESSSFHWSGYYEFEGVAARLERLFKESESESLKERIQPYMSTKPCQACGGKRLKPSSLAVTIAQRNIIEVT